MDRWRGKVAVVTGASAGIGRSTALELARHGMTVVSLARREDTIGDNATSNNSGSVKHLKCDIRNTNNIIEAFVWIKENVGPVSVLVNNAGIIGKCTILDADEENVSSVIETNLIGLIHATKEALASMSCNNIEGNIININSVIGHQVIPEKETSFYTASKHGVTAFGLALKNEIALDKSRIKVTSISPGTVDTDMNRDWLKDAPPDTPRLYGQDIANCVIFALSAPKHVNVTELTIQPVGEIFN